MIEAEHAVFLDSNGVELAVGDAVYCDTGDGNATRTEGKVVELRPARNVIDVKHATDGRTWRSLSTLWTKF